MIGRVLLRFGVIKDVVSVNSPLACNPGVELLIEHANPGHLVIDVSLRWHLVGRRLTVHLVVGVLVVRVSSWSTKSSHLPWNHANALTFLYYFDHES